MSQGNLKNLAKEQFEKPTLSSHQLDKLAGMQSGAGPAEKTQPFRTHYYVAASLAVIFLLAGALHYMGMEPGVALDERIAAEVAGNHINLKPLEVHTSDMRAIRQYFTELDFSPIKSTRLAGNNATLIGGRYCSIQGVTAAQLRLKNNDSGQIQSLYQTAYDPETFPGLPKLEEGGRPVTVYSKGLDIEIWVEKGVLFAITRQKP